jgi:hypothetical protein
MEWDPELAAKLRELGESRDLRGVKGTKERSEPSTKAPKNIIAIRQPGDDVTNQNDRQSMVH